MQWRAIIGFELSWLALCYFKFAALLPVALYGVYALWRLNLRQGAAVLVIFVCGLVIDTLLSWFNVISFVDALWLPLWFVMVWLMFAIAAVEFMGAVLNRPWLAALLGGVGGPISYIGGAGLSNGAMQFPMLTLSYGILVVVWAVLAVILGWSRRFYVVETAR